jgi:hypothetical protein
MGNVRLKIIRFLGVMFMWLSFLMLALTFLGVVQTIYKPTGGSIWFVGTEYTFILSVVFMILAAICLS